MLFNTTTPEKHFIVPKTESNNPYLPVLGYNPDGTKNTWGDISSWIPGVNIAQNALAQGATKGTDANANVQGDMKERIDKLLAEAAIAATVATAGAAAPGIGAAASTGAAITSGAAGPSFGALAGSNILGGSVDAATAIGTGGQVLKIANQYMQGTGNSGQGAGNSQNNPYMPKTTDLTNYNY